MTSSVESEDARLPHEARTFVYVGGWGRSSAPARNGITACLLDPDTGSLSPFERVLPEITVGQLSVSRHADTLYAVDEVTTLPGMSTGGGGQLCAFRIDANTGTLSIVSRVGSLGSLPCYVAPAPRSGHVLVAHHGSRSAVTRTQRTASGPMTTVAFDSSSVVSFALEGDGSVAVASDTLIFNDVDDPNLPDRAQVHSVVPAPDSPFFVICDKFNDRVELGRINSSGSLDRSGTPWVAPSRSGPRYAVFHPIHPWLFVNHESAPLVSCLQWHPDGKLEELQVISLLPEGTDTKVQQSDVVIDPRGQRLYTLARGIDAICVFAVNDEGAPLRLIQTFSLGYRGPRGCAITPDGRFLLVSALEDDIVVTVRIHTDGTLEHTGTRLEVPSPGPIAVVALERR